MALLAPDAGEVKILEMALKDTSPPAQTLRLYTNDKTPAEGDTVADYTEMAVQGYAAIALARAGWSVASASGVTTAQQPQKIWTFDGTGGDITVYGYYVTILDGTEKLLWAERFPSPQTISNNGDQIKITPKITQE